MRSHSVSTIDRADGGRSIGASGGPERQIARAMEAERRQLTVMFVDLVGSTALVHPLDPEDMREMIGAYHRCVPATIIRFEGYVAKYMGDGVLAYFGWPQAQEDEAERAVRAGLAIAAEVSRLIAPTGQVADGTGRIASGLVVVGDLVGEGAAQEQAVVGDVPNLAARLAGLGRAGNRRHRRGDTPTDRRVVRA